MMIKFMAWQNYFRNCTVVILIFFMFGVTTILAEGAAVIGQRNVDSTPLSQGTLFAAPHGTGDGYSANNPTTIYDALTKLQSGSVLFLRGGVYNITQSLYIYATGTENAPIIIESYPGEQAILDGGLKESYYGISTHKDCFYLKIRKIEIRRMTKSGILIRGSYNVIEGCSIHDNRGGGIHLVDGVGAIPYTTGYNQILDNLIHDNSDAGLTDGNYDDGENADGVSISSGKFNLISHNTVYSNSDDGIDSWKSNDSTISYNRVYDNGKGNNGDGNGIKTGGSLAEPPTTGLRTYAHHNLSYNNRALGFNQNSGDFIKWEYNTAYNNDMAGFGNITNDAVVEHNIASSNGVVSSIKDNTQNNSWQSDEVVEFMSLDADSPNFLRPIVGSPFETIGAYEGMPYSQPPTSTNEAYLDLANWDIYDGDSSVANISNITDPANSADQIISLDGDGASNGYRYRLPTPETNRFTLSWQMKYSEYYVIYISCETTAGHRYIQYKPMDTDTLNGNSVVYGLGADSTNGVWRTFTRDLQADLHAAQPNVDIIKINAFMIRGSGYIDELVFRK